MKAHSQSHLQPDRPITKLPGIPYITFVNYRFPIRSGDFAAFTNIPYDNFYVLTGDYHCVLSRNREYQNCARASNVPHAFQKKITIEYRQKDFEIGLIHDHNYLRMLSEHTSKTCYTANSTRPLECKQIQKGSQCHKFQSKLVL